MAAQVSTCFELGCCRCRKAACTKSEPDPLISRLRDYGDAVGPHPCGETRLIRRQGFVLVSWVAGVPAEFGFELDRGLVVERRVEALGVVDVFDEDADLAASVLGEP